MSAPTATTITHSKSGATCEIWDIGATVTSYKTAAGRELIMVSKDAIFTGAKAIRGGIPIAFPQFGQPDKSMPQHGFARVSYWKKDESSAFDNDDAAGISYTLSLKDVVKARGDNQYKEGTTVDCECVYQVKITDETIESTFSVTNTGAESMDFEVLLHTYYLVANMSAMDASKCYVKGLGGYTVTDKVTGEEYMVDADGLVDVSEKSVDRIHTPPAGTADVDVVIGVGGDETVGLTASATIGGGATPVSCVVWNPYKENAANMGDFRTEQYQEMICVEPGIIGAKPLRKGETGVLTQVAKAL